MLPVKRTGRDDAQSLSSLRVENRGETSPTSAPAATSRRTCEPVNWPRPALATLGDPRIVLRTRQQSVAFWAHSLRPWEVNTRRPAGTSPKALLCLGTLRRETLVRSLLGEDKTLPAWHELVGKFCKLGASYMWQILPYATTADQPG